jgi:predicted cobalt transporter CbtA
MSQKNNTLSSSLLGLLKTALSLGALVSLFLTPVMLQSQTAGEGAIAGTVTDGSGAAIPNATITATKYRDERCDYAHEFRIRYLFDRTAASRHVLDSGCGEGFQVP